MSDNLANTPEAHRWWCTAHIKDIDQVSGDLYEACETITHVADVDIVVYQTAEQAEPLVSITGGLEDMTFAEARKLASVLVTLLDRIAEDPTGCLGDGKCTNPRCPRHGLRPDEPYAAYC